MREKSSTLGYYTIGIAALFLLGFLLLIIFGAGVYRDTVTTQDENNQSRALRSYLVTCTSSASADDVELKEAGDGIEGQILTIRDSGTEYGLQVFLRDGMLVESYCRLDQMPDVETAQPIAATSVFEVEQISEGTYAVITDAGRSLLHVGRIGANAGASGAAESAGGNNSEADAGASETTAEGGEPR